MVVDSLVRVSRTSIVVYINKAFHSDGMPNSPKRRVNFDGSIQPELALARAAQIHFSVQKPEIERLQSVTTTFDW